MNSFKDLLARKRAQHGDKFDSTGLAPQFVKYYESGQRIEVDFGHGEIKRGRIGVTTGWKPCFLLMLTTRSIGSSWTLSDDDKVLKVIR